jgi:hypothetical protein
VAGLDAEGLIDTKDGKTYHIGWIIAGLWLTVYKVERMEN